MAEGNINTDIEVPEHLIELDKIFKAKNINAPKWVIRLLNRLLHVEEINKGVYLNRDKQGADFAKAILEYLDIKVDLVNGERIPKEGSPIIVANHPLGGPDGLALIAAVGAVRNDILFPVNDFLMYMPPLRSVFVPVDKVHGNRGTAAGINAAFAGDNALLYFPAGICSRRIKGVIQDLEWKSTVIKKAVQHHRDIVPVFIDARNRRRFYTIANIRKRLGVKFNFEMALLPSEMFAQQGKTFRMTVGTPISWQTFTEEHSPQEWTQWLKKQTYSLNE